MYRLAAITLELSDLNQEILIELLKDLVGDSKDS